MYPWFNYATSSLYSWKSLNDADEMLPSSMKDSAMVSSVTGGREEVGFHMTHLFIVNYSGRIIKASAQMLEAVQNDERASFNAGMQQMVDLLKGINGELMQMLKRCSMTK